MGAGRRHQENCYSGYLRCCASPDEETPEQDVGRIQQFLVTGDNRLKQGVAPEKARGELRAGARRGAGGRARGPSAPLVELRLADLERGSARISSIRSACLLTSCGSAAARGCIVRHGSAAARKRFGERGLVERIDEGTPLPRYELGMPPTRVRADRPA